MSLSKNQLDQIIRQVCDVDSNIEINNSSHLVNDLGINSLRIAELSVALEEVSGQHLFLPDLFIDHDPKTLTVGVLKNYVEKKMAA